MRSPGHLQPRRRWLGTATLLILVTVLLICGQAVSAVDAGASAKQRQTAFLAYAQRVSAAMGRLLGEDTDDAAEAGRLHFDGAFGARSPLERQEAAARGAVPWDETDGSPVAWAARLRQLSTAIGEEIDRTMTAAVELVQAGIGIQPRATEEEEGKRGTSAPLSTPQALQRDRVAKARRDSLIRTDSSDDNEHGEDVHESGSDDGDGSSGTIFSCPGGHRAATVGSTWRCPSGANGETTDMTIDDVLEQDTDLSVCTQLTGSLQCVCPLDAYMFRRGNAVRCEFRPLKLSPELDPQFLCQDALAASLGLSSTSPGEYCLTTSRQAVLAFDVAWHYALLSLDEMIAIQQRNDFPYFLPFQANTTEVTVLRLDNPITGTYDKLQVDPALFTYLVPPSPPVEGAAEPFALSSENPLRSGEAFTAVFSFSNPEVMNNLMQRALFTSDTELQSYVGNPGGVTNHHVAIDLSTVPDACVEGNQLYVETGVRGPGVYTSFRVARIHVSFSDLQEPPSRYKYPRQFNVLYIFVIALAAAIVVGIVLAVLWYFCQRRTEPEDDLVARAQRNRTRKEELEKGKDEKAKRTRGDGGGVRE